jgi:PAS domain S-box-containing protein
VPLTDELEQLTDQGALATAVVETTQTLVCVLDRDGRIVLFNRACEEATGFSRDEAVGRDARELVIPPEEAEAFTALLADVWERRAPHPETGHWLTRDGGRRRVSWSNRPILGEDGEVQYLVCAGLDVTERERDAEALRVVHDEQAALRRVATFVATGAQPEEVAQLVAEEVGRLLGANAAGLVRYDNDETATVLGRWNERYPKAFPLGTILPLTGDTATAIVYRTGRSARTDDYEGVHGELAASMRKLGYRSAVAAPITVAGTLWGAVVATSAGEPLAPEAEARIGDFTELVALALASTDAREQLAASRARIVEASDAERRRLERNLHDGAQQRLVSIALALRLARAQVDADAAVAGDLLDRACEEVHRALEELRELARGLHPALLSERGLGAALTTLADRAPLPVELREVPSERFPEGVEAAVYYLVSETLANVAKHAQASVAAVRVLRDDGTLTAEIVDDGRGGADVAGGSGLRGLVDRVEALGGRLEVESAPGCGTMIRATLPLERAHQ